MRFRFAPAVLLVVAGCSPAADQTPPPDGLSASVMQYRGKRLTRDLAIAWDNDGNRDVHLVAVRLTSDRWPEPVAWEGSTEVEAGYGTGIDFTPPEGTCPSGEPLRVEAQVDYRIDGGERRSTVPVDDPYDLVTALADGDCGAVSFAEAVEMTVGQPRVADDVWTADLTLTPKPSAEPVILLGFAPTLKYAFGPRTPTDVRWSLDRPRTVHLDVVMGRCDPHIVAEDKVGSRFGVRVATDRIDEAYFTLPLDASIRGSLEDFYDERCRI